MTDHQAQIIASALNKIADSIYEHSKSLDDLCSIFNEMTRPDGSLERAADNIAGASIEAPVGNIAIAVDSCGHQIERGLESIATEIRTKEN